MAEAPVAKWWVESIARRSECDPVAAWRVTGNFDRSRPFHEARWLVVAIVADVQHSWRQGGGAGASRTSSKPRRHEKARTRQLRHAVAPLHARDHLLPSRATGDTDGWRCDSGGDEWRRRGGDGGAAKRRGDGDGDGGAVAMAMVVAVAWRLVRAVAVAVAWCKPSSG